MAPELRFAKYVDRTGDCWLWTGSKNPAGYGMFRVAGENMAHRVAWLWANGSIPAGMEIHHACHIRHCVNPAHLTCMTRRQNLQRRNFSRWRADDARLADHDGETLSVSLSPEHTAWVQARAAESGLSPDEIVARAIYRYIGRIEAGK